MFAGGSRCFSDGAPYGNGLNNRHNHTNDQKIYHSGENI